MRIVQQITAKTEVHNGRKDKYKKAAVYVMAATLISKILGFREILLGSRYGATYVTDAYLISMTIPLVLFSSVAAAISTTIFQFILM